MKFTEEQIKLYASPLSNTENEMCKRTIESIKEALKSLGYTDDNKAVAPLYENSLAYFSELRIPYSDRKIKLFVQGSYANNTCVRQESDVDIAVIQEEVFRTDYRSGITKEDYGFVSAGSQVKSFKDEVEEALKEKYGSSVKRKDKSIKINGNTYRKDADTVPSKRYRDYRQDYLIDENNYIGGIVIYPDKGGMIINYPEQHIKNGVQKNKDTNFYYKRMVRVIKKMRYIMQDNNISAADDGKVSSFGLESLLWNVPNAVYTKYSIYRFVFDDVVDYLYNDITNISTYKEANGIKTLCLNGNDITNYSNFIKELKAFYKWS